MNALHDAIASGETQQSIRSLYVDQPELALGHDQNGAIPLHKAVVHSRLDIIEDLVQLFPFALEACDHVSILDRILNWNTEEGEQGECTEYSTLISQSTVTFKRKSPELSQRFSPSFVRGQ